MLRIHSLFPLLLSVFLVSVSPSRAVQDDIPFLGTAEESEFVLPPPKELLRSPGGRAELWNPEFKALKVRRAMDQSETLAGLAL